MSAARAFSKWACNPVSVIVVCPACSVRRATEDINHGRLVMCWCLSSAAGIPVVYLNLWELPALLPKNKAWVDGLKGLHLGLNVSMAVLVSVHVLAALKHHITDRDLTLVRMLPILKRHS